MHKHLIGAASAVALGFSFTAASAAPAPAPSYATVPQAVIGADYSYISVSGGSANSYGGSAGGILPFGGGFSGQVFGGYHSIEANHGGGTLNAYNVAGDLQWSSDMGRVGVNVGYINDSASSASISLTSYGAFGEYFANDQFTLGLKGGGVTASGSSGGFGGITGSGSTTGGYVAGEIVGYATPDIDIQGHADYLTIVHGSQTTVGVQAEWLFSEDIPVSGWVGYDYASLSGGAFSQNSNTVSVGLRYYIGGMGSLVQRHRSGVDGWGPAAVNVLF